MTDTIRGKRGFTLLEVMISLAILAIALVAILGIKERSLRASADAERLTKATILASRLMGEIKLKGLNKTSRENIEDGFKWTLTKKPSTILNLKELRLALWWEGKKIIEVTEYVP